jgi:16S rRNA (guanine(527)-N(7))-methyltransferase RsmG
VFHVKHRESAPVPVSRETEARLRDFVTLLLWWNQTINLVSARDANAVWDRHVLDSLQLAPLIPAGTRSAADLGSGAGFPGLILAIATGIEFALVESDQRKAAFLREAARSLGAPAVVYSIRAEKLRIAPVALVTARALAPLPALLALAYPLLVPGGVCLFPKGRTTAEELTAAKREWHMHVEAQPSHTDSAATLLRISEISRAGNAH